MKLVGYIEPVYDNSFTIPVYQNEGDQHYCHVLDDDFKIIGFEKTNINPELFKPISFTLDHKIGDTGSLAFISEAKEFVGPAKHTLEAINEFVIHSTDNLPSIKEELSYVSRAINLHLRKKPQVFIRTRKYSDSKVLNSLFSQKTEPLVAKYLFEDFIVGSSNKRAWEYGQEIASQLGAKKHESLIVYGRKGMGKTHFMRVLQSRINQIQPKSQTIFLNAGQFGTVLFELDRTNKYEDFFRDLKKIDMLVIDDVHNIPRTERIHEAYNRVTGQLNDLNVKLIISTRENPSNIDWFERRLGSELSISSMVELNPPDIEMRKSFIDKRLSLAGIDRSENASNYITISSYGSIRDLDNLLNALIQNFSRLNSRGRLEIDLEYVKPTIRILSYRPKEENFDLGLVSKTVSNYFKLTSNEFYKSEGEKSKVARQLVYYLADYYLEDSFIQISNEFKTKDEAFVLKEIQQAKILSDSSSRFQKILTDVVTSLYKYFEKSV